MTTKPIQQLDDAILAEMQSAKRTGFSFREIRKICADAIPFLECYNIEDRTGRRFMHEVIDNISNLENNGIVNVTYRGSFIMRIDLTERGKEMLQQTLFTPAKV